MKSEFFKGKNGNVACRGPAKSGMTMGPSRMVLLRNGAALLFTCSEAPPKEHVSDALLQALVDNCAFRIVLAPERVSLKPVDKDISHD